MDVPGGSEWKRWSGKWREDGRYFAGAVYFFRLTFIIILHILPIYIGLLDAYLWVYGLSFATCFHYNTQLCMKLFLNHSGCYLIYFIAFNFISILALHLTSTFTVYKILSKLLTTRARLLIVSSPV